MENMFKRTLLGAAIALAATSANAAIDLAGDALQLYGQAAGALHLISNDNGDDQMVADIESRIGFRGRLQFDDFGPDFIWQMEGGNANNGDKTGGLGHRDTYLGLDFTGFGSLKFGRQLVAAYNYVDWPHSNPGLGNVFDGWTGWGSWKYADRTDNNLRFDSANFGGFTFQASLSGMGDSTDEQVSSVAASYAHDKFSVHGGVYSQKAYTDANDNKAGDWSYGILGGAVYLGDLTLTGAYKQMHNGVADDDQGVLSATAQYVVDGTWLFKAGYSDAGDTDKIANSGATAITGRVGYILPSLFLHVDVRNYSFDGDKDSDHTRVLLGAEYVF